MNIPERFKNLFELLDEIKQEYAEDSVTKQQIEFDIEQELNKLDQEYQKLENPWKDPRIELPNDELKYYCIKEVNSHVYLSIWNKIEKRWYYKHCNYPVSTRCVIAWMEIPVNMTPMF
jgi:hypothetical protein